MSPFRRRIETAAKTATPKATPDRSRRRSLRRSSFCAIRETRGLDRLTTQSARFLLSPDFSLHFPLAALNIGQNPELKLPSLPMKRLILTIAGIALGCWVTPAQTKVDFVKDIQPILEKSCIKCHGPEKQKGKLRLDSKDAVFKRSADAQVVIPGNAEKSDLYRRVSLPPGDDDIMPNEGEPLPKVQIVLIRDWINQGASWPDTASFTKSDTPTTASKDTRTTDHKPTPDELKAIAQLEALGVSARPIAMNSNWREASFHLLGSNVTDTTLAPLKGILGLVDLNLGGTKITDTGLANLSGLMNLARLHLEKTDVTDTGLSNLKNLTNLVYLNLYGTKITDEGLDSLKALANLKHLYLWQTKVSDAGVGNLQKALPKLDISRGWELKTAEKPPDKEAAKDDAKK